MKQSHNEFDDRFITTNQDYGSFYFGRLQHNQIDPNKIEYELSINNQVRNERRQLPSIAYDIMFDKHDSFKIVSHPKKIYQPIISRRQLKYIKSKNQTNEERQIIIKNILESYTTFIKCIYQNKPQENFQISNSVLELIANELFLLNPEISIDELVEYMIAITVPHEYLGMPSIDPNQPYPGTENECARTPRLQHILEHFQKAKKMVADSKQQFDSKAISSQSMLGFKYIYNPFVNARPFRQS
ncbi:unnamed protein product [Rotaria sordida]|uniref:Uncharacterized protein n=1 Tax=Rotaria sordida TaxID=392033 RepID=A0A818LZH4_9BILA|nr:unnamed protein product [Rotaria sordida]